ncbi:hypothetical protein KVV02_008781 [Mortierella alpina]|uniref:Protein kinase domain-containing protein n=1 Tax=Mortierella alpina TaxID=64518 RepID=A0A9P8CW85_MORAP|nr:hypothetical protein KVV02_008781 [Mortierella alpina]
MADLGTGFTLISSLVTGINNSADRVRFNKRICQTLARKCRWIEQLLKQGSLGSSANPALEGLEDLLARCDEDLKKFAGTGFLMRVLRSSGVADICNHHITELDDWLTRIQDASSLASTERDGSLDVAGNHDSGYDEEAGDDEDEEEALRFELKVSQNQDDAKKALLSLPPSPRLLSRAIVNPDHLSTDRESVGKFPCGIIYRGTYNGVAVYIREVNANIPNATLAIIRKGIMLAQCLSDCPNIVPIYGFCGQRMIITAMPANGPLNEYVDRMSTIQKVTIARKIADTLVFMHDIATGRKSVVHRDIRAANVWLSDDLEPMLTGFELCKGDGDQTGYQPDIDEAYKAWWSPERLQGYGTSPQSDVYAFGVLMYEISTGREPTAGADFAAEEDGRLCMEYTALMKRCLLPRFNSRPKIDNVMEDLLAIERILQ